MIYSKNGVFTRLNYFTHRSTKYREIYTIVFGKTTSSCNNAIYILVGKFGVLRLVDVSEIV